MTEGAADHPWFLRKHEDGTIFGPLSFEQLARWAAQAQVAPHDSISTDQQNWIKAPMLPQLRMDWIVEVTSERLYGPTTLGAIREFIELGEIGAETFVINSCDATRYRVRDLAELLAADAPDEQVQSSDPAPVAAGMSIAADDRIRELEEALREERRALADADERYRQLEAAYRSLIEAGQAG
jgi:hypothetical protein